MVEERVQRRLAAILAADVVGYSRLMGKDEEGTRARFNNQLNSVIQPAVDEHGGRLVKTMGDGLLVEFGSVVDAVQCAMEIQDAITSGESDEAEERKMLFRMGVHLGDVIVEGDDIHGDGVNIAARLEGLAGPGGICVSDMVRSGVRNKLSLEFDDLGEQSLKNIAEPVCTYSILVNRASVPTSQPGNSSSQPFADMPSIAVLPFANMSGDPEQEFFADGITEDILTELSRFRDLFVISRTSAFTYKGKALSIQEVAHELGVQFIVEGSVRKAGDRVRVTVQLIDAETDRHIWADRYDRNLEDIFAIQDEITQKIVGTLPGRVEAARRERAAHKPTDSMAAYELVLGSKVLHHRSNRESNRQALDMIARAIALDPKFAHAHSWRACIVGQAWTHGWVEEPEAAWNEVVKELQIALALDEHDSDVHRVLAAVHIAHHEFDKAVFHEDRALSLNPNDDLIVVQKGELLTWLGQAEEGINWIEKAMLLNPYHPERFWSHLGRAYFVAHRYSDAVSAFQNISSPDYSHHAFLAAAHAEMGDDAAAREHASRVLGLEPGFSIADHLETMHYANENDRVHHRELLSKAGLPE